MTIYDVDGFGTMRVGGRPT